MSMPATRRTIARARTIIDSLSSQPAYTLMRGIARFRSVRELVAQTRRLSHARRLRSYLADCESRMDTTVFAGLNRSDFVEQLRRDGLAFGLRLPAEVVQGICSFAESRPCYADRLPEHGFSLPDRASAEAKLGKPVLLAQYFNVARDCPAIGKLLQDPMLNWIAGQYLQSVPTFVGSNLWWTFAVQALEADRDKHAHLFHRDVDDFRFFKFFFYLTDVEEGEGAHVCVVASHRRPPMVRSGDRWVIRRYSDAEIDTQFAKTDIREICGPAGTGFAENTLCVHKGRTPAKKPRLLLQLQYALFDYGSMHDKRDSAQLRSIV